MYIDDIVIIHEIERPYLFMNTATKIWNPLFDTYLIVVNDVLVYNLKKKAYEIK